MDILQNKLPEDLGEVAISDAFAIGQSGGQQTDGARLALASIHAGVNEVMRLAASTSEALGRTNAEFSAGILETPDRWREIAIRTIPRWHFTMLNDHERNDAFAVALERLVQPGSHVLDIGSGTGLLAMMAANAGAGRVTTCESNPLLAEIARQTIAAHHMEDVIFVVAKPSTELAVGRDLPAPADLIVSEIVDCGLVGEGILPTLRDARERLLKRGGRLLPRSARLNGFLIESEAIAGLNRVGESAGYDVRLFNTVATSGHFPVRLSTWPHRAISGSAELFAVDFAADPLADGLRLVRLPVTSDGVAHALVAWFELDLGAGVTIRNSPENLRSHWMQALIALDEPLAVAAGEILELEFRWKAGRLTARPRENR